MSGWRDRSGNKRKSKSQPRPERAAAPQQKPPSPRSGWRAGAAATLSSEQHWKTARTKKSPGFRRLKLAGFLALSVSLVAALVWLVLRYPVSVPFIALTPGAYEHPLPPLGLVSEDIDRFKDVLGRLHKNVVFQTTERQLRSSDEFLTELRYRLEQVKQPGGPAKDVVMLYIRAHGVVNNTGAPCLLLPDSKPLDESTWLPVSSIVNVAKQWDPESKHRKVLLLDLGGLRRFWPAGVLHNGFVSRLKALIDSEAGSRITVIHSAGPGEVSHTAPELQGTSFAYYLAQGIQGDADSNADDAITLHELHEYVQRQVGSFAHRRRADIQTPVLLPSDAADFAIAHASKAKKVAVLPLAPARSVDLDQLWHRFAELRRARAYSIDPQGWAELEARLVRLESLLLAGKAYADQVDQKDVSLLMDRLTRAVKLDAEAASSLAIASRAIDDAIWENAQAKVEQWKKSIGTDKPLPTPAFNEPLASRVAWEEGRIGGPDELQRSNELLQAASTRRSVEYTEIQYMQLLTTWIDWQGETHPFLSNALACQQLAEQAAGPADVRSHYWLRDLVSQDDLRNNDVFDDMLTGSDKARRRLSPTLAQLTGQDGSYHQAKRIGRLISLAYQVRDEAWATIPHLAAWVDSEAWLDGAGVQIAGQVRSRAYTPTVRKLIDDTHELADAMDRLPTDLKSEDQAKRQLDQRIAAVQVGLKSLLDAFDLKGSTLLNDETFKHDERTIRQIAALLQLPLIPNNDVKTRSGLRKRLLSHRGTEYTSGTRTQPGFGEIRDHSMYLEWLTDQDVPHGLAVLDNDLLDPDSEGIRASRRVDGLAGAATLGDRGARLAKLEFEMRSRLADVKASATKLAASDISGSPFECRRGLSKADRLLRAAAPIFARRIWGKQEQEQDPVGRLIDFDQHAFHLWHGHRALSNWWGPVNRVRPYFAESADHQLSARAKYSQLPPKGRPEIEQAAKFQNHFREEIVKQEQILENWQPALRSPGITVTLDEIAHFIITQPVDGLPPGRISLYLSDDESLLPVFEGDEEVRRRAAGITNSVTLNHTIKNARKLTVGSLDANALFRGHRRSVNFTVDNPGQAIVVWHELKAENPRIAVKGDSKEKSQIVFVLDCSGSMETQYRLGRSRLDVAIDTLTNTVRLLGHDHHIGLVLYGHRNNWNNFKANGGINPVDDVELAREVLINDDVGQRNLIGKLKGLRPRGETPLYLAIKTAVASFRKRPEGSKQVVVISDGFKRLPPGYAGTSVQQVKQAWITFKPRIDIVPIVGNLTPAQRATLQQFTHLESPYGTGTLYDNVDAKNLAEKIKSSLRLLNFQVTEVKTGKSSELIPLGRQWQETSYADWNLYDVRRRYRIQVGPASKDVFLEGGEHLDVVYNRRRRQLEFEPFLENSEQRVEIPRSTDAFAVSHFTQRQADSLVFQVSIQNRNRDFSPRPRQVWAEITPLGFNARQNVFYCFDCDFKMRTPVPLLQFRVRNWPGAESARMKLWFSNDEYINGERMVTVPLDRPSSMQPTPEHVTLTAQPERLESGEIRLVIVESHDALSADYPMRVRLIPPAAKTEHQFFTKARRVHHVFVFGGRKSARIGISSKSHLRGAWHEAEAFGLTLPLR